MPNFYIADRGYIAIKPEASEGVAVIPNTFLPVDSAEFETDLGLSADRRMQGLQWETNGLSYGPRSHKGTLKFWCDPIVIGYLLDMALLLGSETGNGTDGYTHPFTPEGFQSYTIEIARGPYAQRFFGVRVNELKLMFEDGKMKCEIAVEAMGMVSAQTLAANLTGASSTSVQLSQNYDLFPNNGLVATDQLVIGADTVNEETATIQSINANGFAVTVSSAVANSHTAGEGIYLKAQTPSFSALPNPIMFGDVLVGFGADASAATTAAASKSTATPVHELELTFSNNLLAAPTTTSRSPYRLLPQQRSCVVTIKQLFSSPEQHRKWMEIEKQAICIVAYGKVINVSTPTRNKLTWTLHKALLESDKQPLTIGEFIMEEQTYRAAYDSSDAKAITVSLVNTKASY